jgi:hypothetical protein
MATKFNLKDLNPGTWFDFNEDDPKSGRICLRVLNEEAKENIRKTTVKRVETFKKGQRFIDYDVNEKLNSEMTWDYVIVSWERLEDNDDQPIECTVENKSKLMRESIDFARFVGECLEKLSEMTEQRKADAAKN